MRIYIITEAMPTTGMGHAVRCGSVYDAFRAKGLSPVMIINGSESFAKIADAIYLDWVNTLGKLIEIINGADIVVVDSYLASKDIYDKIAQNACFCVWIDDNNRLEYPRGIVANGTVGAETIHYPQREGVRYLLGADYIMLRREFIDVSPRVINDRIEKVFITIGGSDISSLTPQIVELLPDVEKHVVLPMGGEIEGCRCYGRLTAAQMREKMIECDVAISAAGQTINELARTGIPSLVFQVADNQRDNINGWCKMGFIDGATTLESLRKDFEKIKNKERRVAMSEKGANGVDGGGSVRIATQAVKEAIASKLTVRRATADDMETIFNLANDPVVRANSFSVRQIEWAEHQEWFEKILSSDSNILYVLELEGDLAAQVRFDIKETETVTNISVAVKVRGFGMGDFILKKAIARLSEARSSYPTLTAYIKSDNKASQRIFEKAGYTQIDEIKWEIL